MKPLLILIAGPYMSGTGGDATKIASNRARLESYALPIYERGHLALVSKWLTLPIVHAAVGKVHGDAVLLFNSLQQTVVLTKQFRFPAYANGHTDGMLIEACAGLLDGVDAAERIKQEIYEELGFHITHPRKLFEAYMSPGSVTEKLHFFAAHYTWQDRIGSGGGLVAEGEDIDALEMPLSTALDMVRTGQIEDAKTIMLLEHAALLGLENL